jgi:UDP-glucose 4-epimerase
VIEAAREVTGHPIPFVSSERRPGDPAVLVASPELAKKVLGWKPKYTDLREMVESGWVWRSKHPQGYKQ